MNKINFPIVQTGGFLTTFNVCKDALLNHNMHLIYALPGYGKSTALKAFSIEYFSNVVMTKVYASHSPRLFYSDVFNKLSNEKYDTKLPLNIIIKRVANLFASQGKNMLLLIDEATKFNHNFFLHLQDFRDLTSENTGIVLAGGQYFMSKFQKWSDDSETGMPEFLSRIDVKEQLPDPTIDEIINIIRAYGIFDNDFERRCRKFKDFRQLEKEIKKYLRSKGMLPPET